MPYFMRGEIVVYQLSCFKVYIINVFKICINDKKIKDDKIITNLIFLAHAKTPRLNLINPRGLCCVYIVYLKE